MDGLAASGEPGDGRQPSLFDSLPLGQPRPRRSRARPAKADAGAATAGQTEAGSGKGAKAAPAIKGAKAAPAVATPYPAPSHHAPPPPVPLPRAAAAAAALDPAMLSNPELKELVRALPDLRLSFLMVEAARELKRRVEPGDGSNDEENPGMGAPNPSLLRAARLVVGELSGEED